MMIKNSVLDGTVRVAAAIAEIGASTGKHQVTKTGASLFMHRHTEMNLLTFLNSLRPAIPFSTEKPCTVASNSELRRWIASGAVLINTEKMTWDELVDFPVFSIVFFPNGARRTTIL